MASDNTDLKDILSSRISQGKSKKEARKLRRKKGPVNHEWQQMGCDIAKKLDDWSKRGKYIKLARDESRGVLEKALSFVSDSDARDKAALFFWKLKELKK